MLKVNLVKIRRWCIERRFNFDLDPYAADNQLFRGVQYFDYEELFKRFRFLKKQYQRELKEIERARGYFWDPRPPHSRQSIIAKMSSIAISNPQYNIKLPSVDNKEKYQYQILWVTS